MAITEQKRERLRQLRKASPGDLKPGQGATAEQVERLRKARDRERLESRVPKIPSQKEAIEGAAEVGEALTDRGAIGAFLHQASLDTPQVLANVPRALLETGFLPFAAAGAGIGEVAEALGGEEKPFLERVRNFQEHARDQGPFKAARVFADAAPTGEGLEAAERSIGEALAGKAPALDGFMAIGGKGETFKKNREDVFAETLEMQERHPTATTAGEGLANVLGLLAVKSPGSLSRAQRNASKIALRGPTIAQKNANVAAKGIGDSSLFSIRPSILTAIKRELPTGLVRTIESGGEAAFLASLAESDDPLVMGMLGAGLQAGGSATMFIGSSIGRTNFSGIALWGLVASPMIGEIFWHEKGPMQGLQEMNEKYGGYLQLGILSALLGAGRVSGDLSARNRLMAQLRENVFNGGRRAALFETTARVVGAYKDGDSGPMKVVNALARNPDALGPTSLEKLSDAQKKGADAFLDQVDRLMKNKTFRRRLDKALDGHPPLPPGVESVNPPDTPMS